VWKFPFLSHDFVSGVFFIGGVGIHHDSPLVPTGDIDSAPLQHRTPAMPRVLGLFKGVPGNMNEGKKKGQSDTQAPGKKRKTWFISSYS